MNDIRHRRKITLLQSMTMAGKPEFRSCGACHPSKCSLSTILRKMSVSGTAFESLETDGTVSTLLVFFSSCNYLPYRSSISRCFHSVIEPFQPSLACVALRFFKGRDPGRLNHLLPDILVTVYLILCSGFRLGGGKSKYRYSNP